MIVQEPVQAAIWHCLNHYSYMDAIFLAERLYAEVDSDDALFLLATCYYRAGKPGRAYSILHKKEGKSSQCKFLLARCCLDLNKLNEVESALTDSNVLKTKSHDDIISEFGDVACFAMQLLGRVCSRTERLTKATEAYMKSLRLNPFLWSSFEALANMGERPDPTKIFQVSSLENFNMCQGSNPLIQLLNISHTCSNLITENSLGNLNDYQDGNANSTPLQVIVSSQTPLSTMAVIRTNSDLLGDCCYTPEHNMNHIPTTLVPQLPPQIVGPLSFQKYRYFRNFFDVASLSPLTPNFGILPLDTPSPCLDSGQNCLTYITPSPPLFIETQSGDSKISNAKVQVSRRSQNLNPNKLTVFSQSGNTSNTSKGNIPVSPTSQTALQPTAMLTVRRSTRLFSSSNSVKENNKSSSKVRFTSSKAPPRKAKTRLSKNSVSQAAFNELNEINKPETITSENKSSNLTISQHVLSIQKIATDGLMQLMQEMGKAYLLLAQYDCRQAVEAFRSLSPKHFNTGWVLSNLGRAYFELGEYQQAAGLFANVRHVEPHRMEGMEYYSTTLWHLRREVALSALTQELTEFEKDCPQSWCATGNCFSLQKEHDTAIKFFNRAIQVDPRFAYAYTLLGHEYVLTEEMDKAMACFRNAIRIDPRHYNAWYGVGMIYYKQEKFQLAEVHFKKALATNSQSSVLMCHIGVVQHALQKTESALITFNLAIELDSKNPLCKFHRASIYFTTDRHQEALKELEELKELVPKESLVYFLIGKVHKKLGNTHLALMNFSWAMDLDPKGANNQIKEAIDKRYTNEDDDVIAASHQILDERAVGDMESGDRESARNSSTDAEEVQLQAMESDESL